MKRWLAGLFVFLPACAPPSVKVVEGWLTAYAAGDSDAMVASTVEADRPLLEKSLVATSTAPMSTLALALPPKPLKHEFIEIEKKEGSDRQVILIKAELKNPLHYEAKRVGQSLPNIPKTRWKRHRYLAVREGDGWFVKLDLEAMIARQRYAERFSALLGTWKLEEAAAMLDSIPPLPDDGNARRRKRDRLSDTLTEQLEEAKKKREAMRAKTASTSTSAPSR
jgi:hypothetical protein